MNEKIDQNLKSAQNGKMAKKKIIINKKIAQAGCTRTQLARINRVLLAFSFPNRRLLFAAVCTDRLQFAMYFRTGGELDGHARADQRRNDVLREVRGQYSGRRARGRRELRGPSEQQRSHHYRQHGSSARQILLGRSDESD